MGNYAIKLYRSTYAHEMEPWGVTDNSNYSPGVDGLRESIMRVREDIFTYDRRVTKLGQCGIYNIGKIGSCVSLDTSGPDAFYRLFLLGSDDASLHESLGSVHTEWRRVRATVKTYDLLRRRTLDELNSPDMMFKEDRAKHSGEARLLSFLEYVGNRFPTTQERVELIAQLGVKLFSFLDE